MLIILDYRPIRHHRTFVEYILINNKKKQTFSLFDLTHRKIYHPQ